jgi:putative zinc finger/helix-turn-helix YgiT family protein
MTHAMVCPKCGYTTLHASQIDEYTTKLADLYRKKKSLLTAKEIQKIRTSLGMSQDEFAKYLNVGVASVKRWELGKAQDRSSDELIRIKCSLPRAEQNVADVLLRQGGEADEFSGKRLFDFTKLANVILYFLWQARGMGQKLGPLHVNKFCWYADAENYRRHRVSITGSRYARLPLGPVLDDYRLIFRELRRQEIIAEDRTQMLEPRQETNLQVFSKDETASMERVWHRYRNRMYKVVGDSHEEPAWKQTPHAELISFELVK